MQGLERTMAQVSDDIGAIDLSHTVKLGGALYNLRPQSSVQRSSEVPTKSGNVSNGGNFRQESGFSMEDTAGKGPPKRKLDDLQHASGVLEDVDRGAVMRRKLETRLRSDVASGDNTSNELRRKLDARMSVARATNARNESLSRTSEAKNASSVRLQSDHVHMAGARVEDDVRHKLSVRMGKARASSIEENPSNEMRFRHQLEDRSSRALPTWSQQHVDTKPGPNEKMLSSGTSSNVAPTSRLAKALPTKTSAPAMVSAPAQSAAPVRISVTAKPTADARMSAPAKPAPRVSASAKTSVIAKTASSASASMFDSPRISSDKVVSDKVPTTSQTGSMPQTRSATLRSGTNSNTTTEQEPPSEPQRYVMSKADQKKAEAPAIKTLAAVPEGQFWGHVYSIEGKPMGVGVVGRNQTGVELKETAKIWRINGPSLVPYRPGSEIMVPSDIPAESRSTQSAGKYLYDPLSLVVFEPVQYGELFRLEGKGINYEKFLNDTCVRVGIDMMWKKYEGLAMPRALCTVFDPLYGSKLHVSSDSLIASYKPNKKNSIGVWGRDVVLLPINAADE
ncbi:hypothetical protein EUX98_g9073 [Antrodiella citrinella]|uniref:Uncharacterized protein n=1 Tax=Antrodiella citrinella TaxID=2447956 RepID=A0A4S4LYH1_9APHY|nr:hypothetical protein EUX98_g9073 [Antrodiella citrinella]